MSNMLSALARSPMGKSLINFIEVSNINEDWDEPKVQAFITGNKLDNQKFNDILVEGGANDEILVHLQSDHGKCILNLNTILAFASAYVKNQYMLVESISSVENGK